MFAIPHGITFLVADSPRSRIMKYPILLKEVKKKVSHTVPQIGRRLWRAHLPISFHYLISMGGFSLVRIVVEHVAWVEIVSASKLWTPFSVYPHYCWVNVSCLKFTWEHIE